jgi:hypothetical protein
MFCLLEQLTSHLVEVEAIELSKNTIMSLDELHKPYIYEGRSIQ